MEKDFINSEINRTNRNLFILNLSLLIGIVLLVFINLNYYYNIAFPNLRSALDPFLLVIDYYRESELIGFVILIVVLLSLLSLWNLHKWNLRNSDISLHPIYTKIASYGSFMDIARQINSEVRNPLWVNQTKSDYLINSWFLQSTKFNLRVIRLTDVMWAYRKNNSYSVNFIPISKVHDIAIFTRNNEIIEPAISGDMRDLFLENLSNNAPWVVIGYSVQLQELWRNSREKFISSVDNRINTSITNL